MARCKVRCDVRNLPGSATGAALRIASTTTEYFVRVVDATGTPVAWQLALASAPSALIHYPAGEGVVEDRLLLDGELELLVFSPANSVIEVQEWAGR